MNRREFFQGMAGILAASVAPAFIGSKILMPVRELATLKKPLYYFMSNPSTGGDSWIRIMGMDYAGNFHRLDEPVTLYKGDSVNIELPDSQMYRVGFQWGAA